MSLTPNKNPETKKNTGNGVAEIGSTDTALFDVSIVSIANAAQQSRQLLLEAIGSGGINLSQHREEVLDKSDQLDAQVETLRKDLLIDELVSSADKLTVHSVEKDCEWFAQCLLDPEISAEDIYTELNDLCAPRTLYGRFNSLAKSGNNHLANALVLLNILEGDEEATANSLDEKNLLSGLANLKTNKNGDANKQEQKLYEDRLLILSRHLQAAQHYEGADDESVQQLVESTAELLEEHSIKSDSSLRAIFLSKVLQAAKLDPSDRGLFPSADDTLSSIKTKAVIVSEVKKSLVDNNSPIDESKEKISFLRDEVLREYEEYLHSIGKEVPVASSEQLEDLLSQKDIVDEESSATQNVESVIQSVARLRRRRRLESVARFANLPSKIFSVPGGYKVDSKPYVVTRDSVEKILEDSPKRVGERRLLLIFDELDQGVVPVEGYSCKDDPKISFKEKDSEIEGLIVPGHLRGSQIGRQMLEYFVDNIWNKKSDLHTSSIRKPSIVRVLENFGFRPNGGQVVHILKGKSKDGVIRVVADTDVSDTGLSVLRSNQQAEKSKHKFYELTDEKTLSEEELDEVRGSALRQARLNATWVLNKP